MWNTPRVMSCCCVVVATVAAVEDGARPYRGECGGDLSGTSLGLWCCRLSPARTPTCIQSCRSCASLHMLVSRASLILSATDLDAMKQAPK